MKKRVSITLNQEISKNIAKTKADCLILGINEGKTLKGLAAEVDEIIGGGIKELVKRGEFDGKVGNSSYISVNRGLSADRLFLIGCGNSNKSINNEDMDKIASSVTNSLASKKSVNGVIALPSFKYESKDHKDADLLQKLGGYG